MSDMSITVIYHAMSLTTVTFKKKLFSKFTKFIIHSVKTCVSWSYLYFFCFDCTVQ